MVYRFFENKDAILGEFVKQGFAMLSEVMETTKNKFKLPEQQLTPMADAYFEFAFSQSAHYQLMFGLGIPNCQKAYRYTRPVAATSFKRCRARLYQKY